MVLVPLTAFVVLRKEEGEEEEEEEEPIKGAYGAPG